VIRQGKGQSVVVCGMLYQQWTARPVTTANGNPYVPDTNLEPYCDNAPALQDMNEEEIGTQDL
jgi:hypothetical protein